MVMNAIVHLLSIFILFLTMQPLSAQIYVIYTPHQASPLEGKTFKARLGNQLLTFFDAYYVTKKHKATLVYTPIDVDIESKVRGLVPVISEREFSKIQNLIEIKKGVIIEEGKDYFIKVGLISRQFKISEEDHKEIKSELKTMLMDCLTNFNPPETSNDVLNIALHIRTGVGFDYPQGSIQFYDEKSLIKESGNPPLPIFAKQKKLKYLDVIRPLKAPPLQYFIDALKIIIENVAEEKRFFIFTDHPDKQYIMNQLNEHLDTKISFEFVDCSSIPKNELELYDLLLLSCVDGLIRPGQSTFSIAAEFLANYKYTVTPYSPVWVGNCLIMTKLVLNNRKEGMIFYPHPKFNPYIPK